MPPHSVGARETAPRLSTCPTVGIQQATVARVDEDLDLALADGRSLHLAGLEAPQATSQSPDLRRQARDALVAQLSGGAISFFPLSAQPDRWGRIPAFVFLSSNAQNAAPVANLLLERGFARYMPEPEAHACHSEFLAAEEKARAAKLGLWHDPFYAIIEATNRSAFADKAATNVIVEGRLVNVTSTGFRTTLEFAAQREHAFSVTILQRNVAIFERSGLKFHALIGRILRIRGLLDLRFGPQIELASTDDLELINNEQEQGAKPQQSDANVAPLPAKNP
ncbi:MAG: thermonuclease family protein [Methylovirgula sp.]